MHIFPIISLSFVITILAIIHMPESSSQLLDCPAAFLCGSINFTHPFWVGNGGNSSCGSSDFEVRCQATVPRISIGDLAYRVLAPVDTTRRTLTVARDDLWNNTCPEFLRTTTLPSNIFSYSNNTRILIMSYGCVPALLPGGKKPSTEFDCSVNGTTTSSFFALSNVNSSTPPVSLCNSSIYVPVNEAAAQNLTDVAALKAALAAGFTLQYQANNTICDQCVRSGGQCSYSNKSNSFMCLCADSFTGLVCNATSTQNPNGRSSGLQVWEKLVIGLSIGIAVIISSLGLVYHLANRYWKSDEGSCPLIEEFMRNYGSIAPKLYSYSEIKQMTNSFADKLGHGGYGCVYRGKLPDGRLVAVKILNDNKGNGEDFINEVATMGRTSHVNVVALLGFCYNRSKRALIYEFMPNGSLDKFICNMGSSQDLTKSHLEWKVLFEIAVGIARGLEYLHRGCNIRIVHFDIKPQNILLDADFCPKISDFGLAKLCKRKESILSTMGARGTVGYIAPEVFCPNFGGMSHKSDVYSYGMMVFEMLGFRRKLEIDSQQINDSENYFPSWIYERVELGKRLPLKGVTNEEEEETARKMILVGLWCILTNPADRPSISKVVEMLDGSLHSIQIPPKPFLESPTAVNLNQESWTTSSIS